MQIGSKAQHAIKIIEILSVEKQAVKGFIITEALEISAPYFEQIVAPLIKGGFIKSVRGCQGGYMLAKAAANKTVWDVVDVFKTKEMVIIPSSIITAAFDQIKSLLSVLPLIK